MGGKKIKPIKSYTTVNFDRQKPLLVISKADNSKSIESFDQSSYLQGWRGVDYNVWRPQFRLSDVRGKRKVNLILTEREETIKQLNSLMLELRVIREAIFNGWHNG
jgi:hypothetical protein